MIIGIGVFLRNRTMGFWMLVRLWLSRRCSGICLNERSVLTAKWLLFSLVIVCFSSVFHSCAKIATPNGGPIDQSPPKICKSIPENGSVSAKMKQFQLVFDEFVQLDNPMQQVIVSPPLQHRLGFSLKGKRLTVSWEDTLKSQTTYAFDFGSAVKDNHEGNVLRSYCFAFSTGDYLDSLSLYGRVLDAYSQKPAADVFVALYAHADDSAVHTQLPDYLTRTDASGYFSFLFLRHEPMRLFAYSDDNQNRRYDLATERFAFADRLVMPSYYNEGKSDTAVAKTDSRSDTHSLLMMYLPKSETQGLLNATLLDANCIELAFRRAVDSLSIRWENPVLPEEECFLQWNVFRDTLKVFTWLENGVNGSKIILSDYATWTDTVQINGSVVSESSSATSTNTLLATSRFENPFPYFKSIELPLKTPLKTLSNISFAQLFSENDTALLSWKLSNDHRHLIADHALEAGKSYTLIIPDSTFLGKHPLTQDTLQQHFKTTTEDDYGTLSIQIRKPEKSDYAFVLTLCDAQGKTHSPFAIEMDSYIYRHLPPGSYRLWAWHDRNKNNRWDGGNYRSLQQPEPTFIYPKPLDIRARWEISETWNLPDNTTITP